MRVAWRLALLLGLLAAAAAATAFAPTVREARGSGRVETLAAELAGWAAAEGAPEWALPVDRNEQAAVRRTYTQGDRSAWVSVAFFTRQDDPKRRASVNRIYPEKNTSRIDWIARPITLDGASSTPVKLPMMVGHKGEHRLVVVYWHQLGPRAYGNDYHYRVSLMREVLFNRQADAVLVRIAVPVKPAKALEDSLRVVSEIAPPLYAAVSLFLAPAEQLR